MVDAIPHATPLLPPTRRYYLSAHGLYTVAELEGVALEDLLRTRPVSAQWRRILLERLDALAVIHRLAAAVSNASFPTRIRLFRAAPADAGFVLPGGRTVAVIRQGNTADRTGFSKRLWRLRERTAARRSCWCWPRTTCGCARPAGCWPARDSPCTWPWRKTPPWLGRTTRYGIPPQSPPAWTCATRWPTWTEAAGCRWRSSPCGLALPDDIDLDAPALDWPAARAARLPPRNAPWTCSPIGPGRRERDLAGLMGVSDPAGVPVGREGWKSSDLLSNTTAQGTQRLALSDRALGLLARRDRTSVGTARRRWSVAPLDPEAPMSWRNVTGSRSRQLLRNAEHTGAVHWFLVALSAQAGASGWQVVQLDPPRRASRYFRHEGRLHSVRPDAFGVLRRGNETLPFFLEWERRAVRPVTMAARLAPYLRYYSSHRPLDDHGATPAVLVVFDDELAATHFLQVARREMKRAGVEVPLWVSHNAILERLGPLERAWQSPGGWDWACPFPRRPLPQAGNATTELST